MQIKFDAGCLPHHSARRRSEGGFCDPLRSFQPMHWFLSLLTALAAGWLATATAGETEFYELPPIGYSATAPKDAIAALQARLADGRWQPAGSDRQLLEALLAELQIPKESQVLVFSKTSLQRQRIRPEHPRAIYFSDTAYVGWVPGGLIEVATIDPVLGPIFYALDPSALRAHAGQAFVRDNDCLRCHGASFTRGVPGVFVRSVFADDTGEPMLKYGSEVVDFRTPFANRWGGWYVTGRHGRALHRGNVLAREDNGVLQADFSQGANLTDLSRFFDVAQYLTHSSDLVALLVLEHQTAMQNTLTRASYNSRRMLDYQKHLQRELNEPVSDDLVYDSVKRVFDSAAQEIVDDLLFRGEAPLPAGVAGAPGFQQAFLHNARRTADGQSLKDFSLHGRIFRNRCSYLIYSEAFLQLPAQLKQRVYTRLARALAETDPDPRFAYLDAAERQRIKAILRETHPEAARALTDSN
jgi:hypothetical protein